MIDSRANVTRLYCEHDVFYITEEQTRHGYDDEVTSAAFGIKYSVRETSSDGSSVNAVRKQSTTVSVIDDRAAAAAERRQAVCRCHVAQLTVILC